MKADYSDILVFGRLQSWFKTGEVVDVEFIAGITFKGDTAGDPKCSLYRVWGVRSPLRLGSCPILTCVGQCPMGQSHEQEGLDKVTAIAISEVNTCGCRSQTVLEHVSQSKAEEICVLCLRDLVDA
jgi:hypothetical protein